MKIIPAIDLIDNMVVRLKEGKYKSQTVYSLNAVEQAKKFEQAGCKSLHIVDLSRAFSQEKKQTNLIAEIIKKTSLSVQVGGGIRSLEDLEELFNAGATKAIIGSLAITNPSLTEEMLTNFGGERIVLALDIKQNSTGRPLVYTNGWQSESEKDLWQVAKHYLQFGLKTVLTTDIARDGILTGPNTELYKAAMESFPQINWIASGGVSNLNDLATLRDSGTKEVVVGKAIYESKFTVEEALEVAAASNNAMAPAEQEAPS